MFYGDQPFIYRTSANPGFHEAVGDTISLSVSTPRYLVRIGLLKDYVEDEGESGVPHDLDLNSLCTSQRSLPCKVFWQIAPYERALD